MSSPFTEPPPRNRLTIAFLMLWTLGSAIILACNRALENPQQIRQLGLAYSLYLLCYAVAQGVAVASVPLFLARKFARRGGFPTQPGHWILLIRGLTTLTWMTGWASRVAIERIWNEEYRSDPGLPNLYLAMQYLPASLLAGVGYALARRRGANEGQIWQLTLSLMLFNAIIGFLAALAVIAVLHPSGGDFLPYSINTCFNQVIGVLLISASVSDRGSRPRDFLHWAGVTSYLTMIVLPFAYSSLFSLLRS
jgi:hypothetical protein